MKFAVVTLYVKDMEKSLTFYNTLLEMSIIRKQPIGEEKELVFLGNGGEVQLELIPSDEDVTYSGFSIGFETENLLLAKKCLEDNGYPIKSEMAPNPFTTLCFLQGPNGEEVELIEYKKD